MSSTDAYWIALRRVRGLGPRTCRHLLEQFGSAEEIFKADEEQLREAGLPRTTARNLKAFTEFGPLERELCELRRLGARLIRWTDAEYPENLRHIPDPPPCLYARGATPAGERNGIAVVGARLASDAGRRMARRLGMELSAHGFTVVSGLARGIDSEAHRGALEAGGRTVAVLGSGVDVIYPPEHRELAVKILENNGTILSELPLGTPPMAENFPTRNRILSGICLGVIVVEAAEQSGSLITARLALEQDRQVFAVPGSPLNGKARGSNRLIKQGARLVDCVEDVIEELAPQLGLASAANQRAGKDLPAQASQTPESRSAAARLALSETERKLVENLKENERIHVDALIEGCDMEPALALQLLLELELKGIVVQHPGKLFSLA